MMAHIKLIITAGLGTFALFFGAGNLALPLYLGAHSGTEIWPTIGAFIISGIFLPFIGLVSMLLQKGNYLTAYYYLGKKLSLLILGIVVLILGPLVAIPRCLSLIAALSPTYLHFTAHTPNLIYCTLMLLCFLIIIRKSSIMHSIGKILAPMKLLALAAVITCGIFTAKPLLNYHPDLTTQIEHSLIYGYNTMDLLASIFFSGLIYLYITNELKKTNDHGKKNTVKVCIYSSLLGWGILAGVYALFAYVAATHAKALTHASLGTIINVLSANVLGYYGGALVFTAVSIACFVTVIALTKICTDFFYEHIFNKHCSYIILLLTTLGSSILVSNLGFDAIVRYASPFLEYGYPLLVILTVFNLGRYLYSSTINT